MDAAELGAHRVRAYGRDYSESDDGYSDMEAEAGRGWAAVSGWGRDGWDLGDWPYVVLYVRPDRADLLQIVEGDRTLWHFDTAEDRDAAIDYLFLWYSAGEGWSPLQVGNGPDANRAALDAGTFRVPPEFRGPFSWGRAERERSAESV